jgi:retinol dehydrogenase 12
MNAFCKTATFVSAKDIPPLDGKVILVTGANVGLGKQAVLEFARHKPARIWLACRSVEKGTAAAHEIEEKVPGASIKILQLDLTSFDSIQAAAMIVLSESDRLDILMLNAGIMGAPPGLTKEGYEIQFGTNHMGHALLTNLLLPLLNKTANFGSGADVRVISLTSYGHAWYPKGPYQFDTLKTTADGLGAYGRYYQSKLANVLWVRHMAKMHPQLTIAAIHPGVVQTQLMERATATPTVVKFLTKASSKLLPTVEQGARNQLWASVSKDVQSGQYYEPIGVGGKASEAGKDDKLAEKLWKWTEEELKSYSIEF